MADDGAKAAPPIVYRKYRAVINYDWKGKHNNQRTALTSALEKLGWYHAGTTAFVIDENDIMPIWQGIDLVRGATLAVGEIRAVTFHIQKID